MIKSTKQKIDTLIEALPYIKKYYGKTVVIKYGGNAMIKPSLKRNVMMDIVLLKHVGMNPVIVHGGGPAISKAMQDTGVAPTFIDGHRVTDKSTIDIVERVFESINKEICSLIKKEGGKPLSVSGRDHKLITVRQKDPTLGFVGEIKKINPQILNSVIRDGFIPVISPIGIDSQNQTYNINADTTASALAVALNSEKLTILTDVDGVFERGKRLSHLTIIKAHKKIRQGIISKGMIPKVLACLEAVKHGCQKSHLINGTLPHSLLLEIFTDKGTGTEFVRNERHWT